VKIFNVGEEPQAWGSYEDAEALRRWSFERRTPEQRLAWLKAALEIAYQSGAIKPRRLAADGGIARMTSTGARDMDWTNDVLGFWFDELGESRWFAKNEALDATIRRRFLPVYEHVLSMGATDIATPLQALAAVLVLDQFPRNMFRGTARAFAADAQARDIARRAVAAGLDAGLTPAQRLFLYLPFEHSEDAGDQALAVRLIQPLGNDSWTAYARAHQSLIERFGRFPHRNAILGRVSTSAEEQALAGPMGSF